MSDDENRAEPKVLQVLAIETALRKGDMTNEEIAAFATTIDLANQVLALPVLHSMDNTEFCHAIHIVQEKLMSRPMMRRLQDLEK